VESLARLNLYKNIFSACLINLLVACSGGGGSELTVVSTKPTLSKDQAAFESFALSPNASYKSDTTGKAGGLIL
jgi:hypothetical protein